eukprot:TRINITY_DN1268_c0_g3_i1.p3 TRINITY_DN1268_c0_g3~~TRINITY_DN1268_c0_g3_i1.p3  ORF type:complete len:157 (+),score=4.01 TRINITY_DN1268_c0_g3_i1:1959-2429(+)
MFAKGPVHMRSPDTVSPCALRTVLKRTRTHPSTYPLTYVDCGGVWTCSQPTCEFVSRTTTTMKARVEAKLRDLTVMTRTLLLAAHLPPTFWSFLQRTRPVCQNQRCTNLDGPFRLESCSARVRALNAAAQQGHADVVALLEGHVDEPRRGESNLRG